MEADGRPLNAHLHGAMDFLGPDPMVKFNFTDVFLLLLNRKMKKKKKNTHTHAKSKIAGINLEVFLFRTVPDQSELRHTALHTLKSALVHCSDDSCQESHVPALFSSQPALSTITTRPPPPPVTAASTT